MENSVKVAVLENEVEALLLETVLAERGIPCFLRSYHDAAYDGLFQAQSGWGAVYAPREHRDEIRAILADLRNAGEQNDI